MLFESGSGAEVDLSLYAPPRDRTRPIDAYVVTECEGDVTGSARRAVEAVCNVLQQHGQTVDPVVVGFDLQGLPGGRPVTGESGGLAFAIALAKRLLDHDPGPVAATGEIMSGHGGGPVAPVKGIIAKIEAASRLLPEKGWVFYPQENDQEIPADLRTSLTEKGLRLQPVSSVAETLGHLFTLPARSYQHTPSAVKTRRALMPGLLVLLLIAAVALLLARIHGWPPFFREISGVGADVTRHQVSGGLTDPKEIMGDSDKLTVSLPKPAQGLDLRPDVRLSGETWIAKRIAQLTTKALEKLLKRDVTDGSNGVQINGKVVVTNRVEDYSDTTGQRTARMTVAIKGLTVKSGNTIRPPREFHLEVKGQGTAKSLLPQAAAALAREIMKAPPVQKEVQKEEKTGHGFD